MLANAKVVNGYSNESTRWAKQSRLHTIWVGGFDGEPFMRWVMDVCRWIVQVVLRPKQTKGFVLLKTLGSRAHFRLDDEHSAIGERL